MNEKSAAAIAADSLGLHVLREIVDQFMQLPGFAGLTQAQQQVHIERLDGTVRKLIAEALGVIFSAEYPACPATLDKMRVGKSITLLVDVDRTAESRHELMDRAGQKIVVVMADPDRYYQRMMEVKARSDQRDLFHDPEQPLGHMGVEEPPKKDPPPPETAPGGASGLDDAMPEEPADPQVPIDMVTADSVWAALQAIGYHIEIFGDGLGLWTEAELHDCMVWALAAKQFVAEGKDLPPLPASIAGRISFFKDENSPSPDSSAASAPANADEKREEPVPAADDIVGITASLRARGIEIKGKTVSRWSQTQRVAAVAWLAGRASQRPDFIPPPTTESGAVGT